MVLLFFKEGGGGGRFINAQDQQEHSHKLITASRSTERAFLKINNHALCNILSNIKTSALVQNVPYL